MLFNSLEFIFAFLPVTFFIYFYLNHKRLIELSQAFLVISSLFFYSWWNVVYLPLILISMIFNYGLGITLTKKEQQKRVNKKSLLTIGIIGNLSLLGYFKYSDFFIINVNQVFGSSMPLFHLALPLAISFFTFQQIAFLVDMYRGEVEKEYDFLNYAIFVTFFPQLIAGPIVHHKEMMPQFANVRNKITNYKNIALGLFLFSIGLFKKVILADTFAVWATKGFDIAQTLNFFEAWATSLSYTFQLYFDFSGYTDMAIGTALFFNIKLPINFNSPYKALDIQDFWRRWHITLSRFLKDYVYIPLGGNRKGKTRTYVNLIATFLIGGLWHGAGWTFVFWGLLHGIAIAVHRAWKSFGFNMNKILAWFITFNFVNIAWVFFRAKEWEDAIKVLRGMIGNYHVLSDISTSLSTFGIKGTTMFSWETIIWIVFTFSCVLSLRNSIEYGSSLAVNYRTSLFSGSLFVFSILSLSHISQFLYFNF